MGTTYTANPFAGAGIDGAATLCEFAILFYEHFNGDPGDGQANYKYRY
mgnify:CR=1 FL=1